MLHACMLMRCTHTHYHTGSNKPFIFQTGRSISHTSRKSNNGRFYFKKSFPPRTEENVCLCNSSRDPLLYFLDLYKSPGNVQFSTAKIFTIIGSDFWSTSPQLCLHSHDSTWCLVLLSLREEGTSLCLHKTKNNSRYFQRSSLKFYFKILSSVNSP